jgi:hypothetical protein
LDKGLAGAHSLLEGAGNYVQNSLQFSLTEISGMMIMMMMMMRMMIIIIIIITTKVY